MGSLVITANWGALANPRARRRLAEAALSGIAADEAAWTEYVIINQSTPRSVSSVYYMVKTYFCPRRKLMVRAPVVFEFPPTCCVIYRGNLAISFAIRPRTPPQRNFETASCLASLSSSYSQHILAQPLRC